MKDILLDKNNRKLLLRSKSEVFFIFLFLILMIIVSTILDDKFLTSRNITNLVQAWTPMIFATYAQTIVLLMGTVDLSVGSVITLGNVICAVTMSDNPGGWILPVVLSIAAGALTGLVNGILITKGRQQPIILTLATSTLIAGIALTILPQSGGTVHKGFARLLNQGLESFMPAVIWIILTVVVWILLNRTNYGRSLYAVGGNEQSAKSVGIHVDKTKVIAFVIAGMLSAMAGVFLTAYTSAGNPLVGIPYTERAITAAVVGGVSMAVGGKGGVIGGIAGVLILAIINNILNLIRVNIYYGFVLQGGILILALAVSMLRMRAK